MYINNDLCLYKIRKEENKCDKIFRPWDNQAAKNALKDTAQDSTVSTTTKDDEVGLNIRENKSASETKPSDSEDCNVKSDKKSTFAPDSKLSHCRSFNSHSVSDPFLQTSPIYLKRNEHLLTNPDIFMPTNPLSVDFLHDPYNSVNPDLVQTNLAHQLGLPPNDPLILESLAQGYALEEYARVLSQEQQAKLMAAKKQRPKKYKCPHCDVGFSNNGQLKGHIRIHTGERPFKCDEKDCGKTFTRNEELTRHKRIHSGLRPFPCSHCGKRFGRKDHLKKHSRTHFQPRGLYAVPVVLPFEAWASGQTNGYPFFPVMY